MDAESSPQGTILQVRRTIAASREAVFHAWTDPALISQWFGTRQAAVPHVEVDLRPGGNYDFEIESPRGKASLSGEYLEVKPPERLVYTFRWGGAAREIPDTQVTVEFYDRGDETEIVLTHERQPSPAVRQFHESGWTISLERLSELVEVPPRTG